MDYKENGKCTRNHLPFKDKKIVRNEMISFEMQRFDKEEVDGENKLKEFIIFNF